MYCTKLETEDIDNFVLFTVIFIYLFFFFYCEAYFRIYEIESSVWGRTSLLKRKGYKE